MATTERTPLRPELQMADAARRQLWKRVAIVTGVLASVAFIGGWWAVSSTSSHHVSTMSPADVPAAAVIPPGIVADNITICNDTKNDAGYIKLPNKKDDHYFYWFFES
uniref:Uncharacterized protein n=1 Tax=Globisporangium ultimum (strain ATCC 200006 / CBS 805.95 / DAOM BR144) TaxID=431595 RepID=K3XA13_GLOUD